MTKIKKYNEAFSEFEKEENEEIDKKNIIITAISRVRDILTILENADASDIDGSKISMTEYGLITKLIYELDGFEAETEL